MQPDLQRDLAIATDIARRAGAILRDGVATFDRSTVDFKSTAIDPVTEYDQKSEAFIVSQLQNHFRGDAIQGEEGGTYAHADGATPNGRKWYVDPLDGTVNFAHGVPHFSVSLGLLIDGEPALGVVYNPMLDELFAATHHGGATLNGRRIHVSKVDTLVRVLAVTGFPYDRQTSPENNFEQFLRIKKTVQGVRRSGSAALDLCYVACGRFDAYWEMKIKPHDIAAGVLIVREAGGTCSSWDGNDAITAMFDKQRVVATNGRVHAAMRALL